MCAMSQCLLHDLHVFSYSCKPTQCFTCLVLATKLTKSFMLLDSCLTKEKGGCSQICNKTADNKIVCSCKTGYTLQQDGKKCKG